MHGGVHAPCGCSLRLVPLALPRWPSPARAFETAAKAAILVDYRTGAVLFAKNADERAPAGVDEQADDGLPGLRALQGAGSSSTTCSPVSEPAWKMGGSQMFLEVGDRVRVEDLLRGIIIQSGNDACVVIAEALAGSEAAFADVMNEKARELGLTASHFANSTGLDAPEHLMSVRDLAMLAPPHHPRFSRVLSIITPSGSSPSTASSSPTATRCCRPACPASTA